MGQDLKAFEINFKDTVFKKIFYIRRCKRITITIHLAVTFYPACII